MCTSRRARRPSSGPSCAPSWSVERPVTSARTPTSLPAHTLIVPDPLAQRRVSLSGYMWAVESARTCEAAVRSMKTKTSAPPSSMLGAPHLLAIPGLGRALLIASTWTCPRDEISIVSHPQHKSIEGPHRNVRTRLATLCSALSASYLQCAQQPQRCMALSRYSVALKWSSSIVE